MRSTLPGEALNQIFREARTHGAWLDKPVSDETLRQLYDLMKWGPTSANGSPARFVFLRTSEAKERSSVSFHPIITSRTTQHLQRQFNRRLKSVDITPIQ